MEPDAANPVPRRLKLESVLHNDPDGRVASALCSTRPEASAPSRAIVILSKKPWSDADIRAIVEGSETELNEYHRNDKFSKYDGRPPAPINEVQPRPRPGARNPDPSQRTPAPPHPLPNPSPSATPAPPAQLFTPPTPLPSGLHHFHLPRQRHRHCKVL